jgi:hypothetical protein
MTRPVKGKWRRRILIFLVASILLLLIVRTGVDFWAGRRVNAVIASLEQRYGTLDVTTMAAPPVPASENRARAIRAAVALLNGRFDFQQPLTQFLAQRDPTPVPDVLRSFVEGNQAALKVADEARSRPQSNWEVDYPIGTNALPWMDIRMLSHAIYLATRMDLDAGKADDAATRIASGLALSASLRQEPAIIAQLMRCALALQQFEAVQRLVTQAEPSKAALEDLARWLVETRSPDPMHLGLLSELKFANQGFKGLEQGDTRIYLSMANRDRAPFWVSPLAWVARPIARIYRMHALEQMGHLLDVQTGPRPRPAFETRENWSWVKRTANIALPGLERTMDTGDLFNSALGVTELAVALRRFRLEHGRYPDTLTALVPAYVANLPIDPETGKPPVYARQGAGFQLRAEKVRNASAQTAATLTWTVPK